MGVIVSGLVASLAGPLATAQSPPKLHYEQDFALNPALAAHPRDVVVFDLEPTPRGRPKGVQHARYRLDAGVHTVCLDDNDPFLTDLILEDGRGKPVLRLHRHRRPKPKSGHREARSRPQCARANLLRADTYTLRAVHAGRSITEAHRVAFLQPGPASPRLVDADGNPADGFWALRPDPGQGRVALVSQWSPSGDMSFTRAFPHTATLLSTGRVLVAGGGFGQDLPPNPELYDPGTGQWTRTGAMVSELSFHTATLLPSGRVLVAGGITNEGLSSSAELYDPGSGLWTPTGAMRTARLFHTATLLPSGQVLIAGGSTTDFVDINAIATAELYDPGSGLWKPTGAMRAPRAGHTATLLASGQVLVAGADDTGTGAELYDPATSNWTPTGAMRVPRARLDKQPVPNHTATLLASGQVLVTGGSEQRSAEIYDPATGPATGHWTPTGAMTQARGSHTATLLASGRVLVSGGTLDFGTPLASAELYDPVSGTWAPTGSLGTARWDHTATRLPAGQVLAAGGNNVDQSFQS
ncbi:MAG: Kelch repeat-containing protein, partial [Candidatus Rokuibacteriota bacterium]